MIKTIQVPLPKKMKVIKRIKKIEKKAEEKITSLHLTDLNKISILIEKIVKNAYVQGVIDGSSETQKRLTKK